MDDSDLVSLPPDAAAIARGTMRALDRAGWRTLLEFSLSSGRRADILALDKAGRFLIVEIKSSAADFRSDRKWREYFDYCDFFSFSVSSQFPLALLPPEAGLFVADAYDAIAHRPPLAMPSPLAPARRRQLLIRFGRLAADRLRRGLVDPEDGIDWS
jgi:hypothetical protein